jgi:cytochrome c peroxidase
MQQPKHLLNRPSRVTRAHLAPTRASRCHVLRRAAVIAAAVVSVLAALPTPAMAVDAATLLAEYRAKAGSAASPARGEKLFNTNFGRDLGFSCASCHGPVPTRTGKDQVTDKPIAPLAPAANAKRFTDRKRVEYMFRVNCTDVVGRECTAGEKADVLAWLISLAP